ncbi:MAG TPA: maleylacetate reductase [Steroidobacteraceae bacterium]
MRFTYTALPGRVVFGAGVLASLPDEAGLLGKRALVLCTPGHKDLGQRAAALLGEHAVGIFDRAVMHVPVETANAACELAQASGADLCVAIGGGSTTGLAKAIALRTDLPILTVPTTYAGSEMTPTWGLTEGGVKRTGRDSRVLPRTTLYDPELTLSLPPALSATSGINAIAHCVESLYSDKANPLISLMAEEGIRALGQSLPRIVRHPENLEARADALYGAWLSGITLGSVGMALHHKLCHTLGGTFNLPHAQTHTIILPHAMAYNAPSAPEAMSRVARALGSNDGVRGVVDLIAAVGAPTALKDIGMPEEGLERAVELATTNPYYNPAPVRKEALRHLLRNAYEGRAPESYCS